MKYKEIRKTKRYKTERAADGAALTRSSFEFLYFVIILIFVLALVFGVFLRIESFEKTVKGSDQKLYDRNYSVITLKADKYEKGDIVTYSTGSGISAGQIIAEKGEKIIEGNENLSPYNWIIYNNEYIFEIDRLRTVLKDFTVPKGYVLINGDLTSSENQVVGELVRIDDITGKAAYIVYPFSLFGRTADYLKR